MKKLCIIAGVVLPFAAMSDGITWETPKNITGDADVRTDGVLRYAYANAASVVNGVSFSSGMGRLSFPNNQTSMADVSLENFNDIRTNTGDFATRVPDGASDEYLQLIRAAVYINSTEGGGTVTSTITLNNLIEGHNYIVQVWTHDQRENPGNYRSIKIDDTQELRLRTSTGFGQHITGAFTATTETQSFTITGYVSESTKKSASQFNSIQLRDVTAGCIDWQDAIDIVDESDVRLDGEPVFAATRTASAATANGVVFTPIVNTNSVTEYLDVRMSTENAPSALVDSTSDSDYVRIVKSWIYANGNSSLKVNLQGLTTGAKYLVQIWIGDYRNDPGLVRYASIDGGRRIHYKSREYGQHMTGYFTADSSTKSFLIRPLHSTQASTVSPQLNAIQLRRLDTGASTHWRTSHITKRAYDIRTDGNLLYAYNFAAASQPATVNGVPFAGITDANAKTGNDDFTFAWPAFNNGNNNAFGFTDSATPSEYITLLQSAVYSKGGAGDDNPSVITLKRLTPGHRYLVQLLVNESRNYENLRNRYMELDGLGENARLVFQNVDLFNPPRGDVATGLFIATAETQTLSMLPGNFINQGKCAQLNAMQVRDLGVAKGVSILAENVPMWYIDSDATLDLDGATRNIGPVSGAGTITNGTLSGTLVIADGSAITIGAVALSAGIKLNGASSVNFSGDANLEGMQITLDDPEALAAMNAPFLSATGTLTGVPSFALGKSGYTVKQTSNGYVVKKVVGTVISLH